jgi:pimeloyl-ACP methyl ester carboxylesterase
MRSTRIALALSSIVTAALVTTIPASAAVTDQAARKASTARVAAPAPVIAWGKCDDPLLRRFKAQCGMLTVPLDHADPGGPTIRLAVSRILHTKEPYRGVVVTNPGGPGGSGTFLAVAGQFVPGGVGQTYDWYGVDPRGVGASEPALTCDNHYFGWNRPDFRPATSDLMRYWRKTAQRYAHRCSKAGAAFLLDHLRTTDNVADFEVLRESIGAQQVTFYGASYGTYFAQVYATLHPDRIKAMVLDGVVDPDRAFYKAFLDQDRGIQKSLDGFFAWVGRYPGIFHLGRGRAAVTRAYQRLRRELAQHPVNHRVGPDELDDAIEPAAFTNEAWPDVASALSALANHGRASGVATLYRDGYPVGKGADNGHAVGLATTCTDAPWPEDWATWKDDARRVQEKAPYYIWPNTWYFAPCRTWPAPAGPRVEVTGAGFTAPILMLNETLDGATPFGGALAARALFPSAALVAGVGGTSHAVGLHGVACTDNAVAALLRNGSLPTRKAGNRADKECKPLAPPDPTG